MSNPLPSIDVKISTSSSIIDLASQEPWSIKLDLLLSYTRPITFPNAAAELFSTGLLREGGLTFTNITTLGESKRETRDVCGPGYEDIPLTERTEKHYTTLHPGQRHIIDETLTPIPAIRLPIWRESPNFQAETDGANQESFRNGWKWCGVNGLEDGQTYELGVSPKARVKCWAEGTKEEIMATIQRSGAAAVLEKVRKGTGNEIEFRVTRSTTFTMKRPDKDGSLGWP